MSRLRTAADEDSDGADGRSLSADTNPQSVISSDVVKLDEMKESESSMCEWCLRQLSERELLSRGPASPPVARCSRQQPTYTVCEVRSRCASVYALCACPTLSFGSLERLVYAECMRRRLLFELRPCWSCVSCGTDGDGDNWVVSTRHANNPYHCTPRTFHMHCEHVVSVLPKMVGVLWSWRSVVDASRNTNF